MTRPRCKGNIRRRRRKGRRRTTISKCVPSFRITMIMMLPTKLHFVHHERGGGGGAAAVAVGTTKSGPVVDFARQRDSVMQISQCAIQRLSSLRSFIVVVVEVAIQIITIFVGFIAVDNSSGVVSVTRHGWFLFLPGTVVIIGPIIMIILLLAASAAPSSFQTKN